VVSIAKTAIISNSCSGEFYHLARKPECSKSTFRSNWTNMASNPGIRILLLALCCLSPVTDGQAQNLREAMLAAFRNNPQLAAARANQQAVNENAAQAWADHMPKVSAYGEYGTRGIKQDNAAGGDRYTSPHAASISVKQAIFRGFRTNSAVHRAKATIEAGTQRMKSTEQSVLLAAVRTYMDVLCNNAEVAHRRNNVEILQSHLIAARRRLELGATSRTDVAQAKTRLARAKAAMGPAISRLTTAQASYNAIVGNFPEKMQLPAMQISQRPASLAKALELAIKNNPSILEAVYKEQASDRAIAEAKGELLPTLNAEARYSWEFDTSTDDTRQDDMTVKLKLDIPLYQGGDVISRIRQAHYVNEQRHKELDHARNTITTEAVKAWEDLIAADVQTLAGREEIAAAAVALEGVKKEYIAGQRTMLDILDAESEILEANLSLIKVYAAKVVAHYSLLSTTGRLDITNIPSGSACNKQAVRDPDYEYIDDSEGLICPGIDHEGIAVSVLTRPSSHNMGNWITTVGPDNSY
jgi:outer membrane protein